MPLKDRPYEKLQMLGASNLTNSELLAIIIKTGTKKYTCLDIARNILREKDDLKISDLEYLNSLSLEELKQYEGIGQVKAIQILAVLELSKRISDIYSSSTNVVVSPKDVYDLVGFNYLNEKQEVLKTILLNKKNAVISVITNAIGANDSINISLKEVLSHPIKQMAHSIILVHNHPSGTLIPSKQDINFTKEIYEKAKIFNINLLDHIIIANNNYISLKEKGYIK